jgi:hypothetical protein
MENKLTRYGTIAFICVAMCLTILAIISLSSKKADASLADSSQAYESTTTRTAITGVPYTQLTYISQGFGTLGSVVITGANTGVINIYDATSTVTNTQLGTTTLAVIPASMAAGTYTFDVRYNRGLVIEVVGGLAPTSTITWKK